MFVGSGHSASKVETVDVVCKCASCGVSWTLRMRAVGVGYAVAPYFLGQTKAKIDAANAAHHDAIATARLAVSFARCSACGHALVPRHRHWLVRLSPAFVALIGLGVTVPLLQPYIDPTKPPTPLWAGLTFGIGLSAIALFTRLRERRRALDAAEEIEWFRGEPPDKPFLGIECAICRKKINSDKKGERCPECGMATHKRCANTHAFAAHARTTPSVYRGPSS